MNDPSTDSRPPGDTADGKGNPGEPAPGLVDIRSALVGLGFIWLTAVAAIGSVQAGVYGATVSAPYLLVSLAAAAVAVVAARASLRTFGYR